MTPHDHAALHAQAKLISDTLHLCPEFDDLPDLP